MKQNDHTVSVPFEKILHGANFCFSEHSNVQPCRYTICEAFQALYDSKCGMLQVRENEIYLRKWLSGNGLVVVVMA